jgi:hypothetical protein
MGGEWAFQNMRKRVGRPRGGERGFISKYSSPHHFRHFRRPGHCLNKSDTDTWDDYW